jgi:hypothetical protein
MTNIVHVQHTNKRRRLPPRSRSWLDVASCSTVLWGLLLSLSLPASSAFLSIPAPHPTQSRRAFPGADRLSTGTTASVANTDIVRRRQTSEADSEWMDPYEDEKETESGDNEILNDFMKGSTAATSQDATSQDREQATATSTSSKPASSAGSMLEQRDGEDDDKWRRRQERFERLKRLDERDEEASNAMNLPEQPLVKTLSGGSSLIFAMAKRMWDPKIAAENEKGKATEQGGERVWSVTASRQEFAATIWKNARKGNKPGMWRYAVRTFDRMMEDEKLGLTIHYEGALTACAKLGMWERALEIYHTAQDREATLRKKVSAASKAKPRLAVRVNDNMVMSLLRACVRASRQRQKVPTVPDDADADADADPAASSSSSSSSSTRELQERQRIPLDAAVKILQEIETRHGLTLTARHLNPVAAAYLSLGLVADAASLLQSNLADRTTGPEAEDGEARFNVNDLTAKDKGSYSLLVQGAVSDADWAGAVDALTDMTEAGLYPVARNLNTWTEVSERKTKRRATRSWKKKRDESYLDSVR